MKLVVVGGHSRNIGKTSVAAALIAATRELEWTAMKITQFGHHICSARGGDCACTVTDPSHPFAITREESRAGGTDTSRFLVAGAVESYWVRTRQGQLGEAMPAIRQILADRPFVMLESNSVMRFLRPDLYVVVLDWETADFKSSAREYLDRADAFVLLETSRPAPAWKEVPLDLIERRPVFRARPPAYFAAELLPLVRAKLQ